MLTKPLMTFESPAGDSLLFSSLRGTAELGRPYQYEVTLLSRNPSIDLRTLIGKKVAVELALPAGGRRRFEGYVTRFTQTGMRGRYHTYQASLRPWLWLMTRRTNSRIFQGALQDIVKTLTEDKIYSKIDFGVGMQWQINRSTLIDREFCVQYRESDFNFLSRLLEDEGIHYWFWDDEGREKLLFADSLSVHEEVPGYESLPYARLQDDAEVIHAWRPEVNLRTSAVRLVDYDFTNPPPFEADTDFEMPLDTLALDPDPQNDDFPDLELFDYPGGFTDIGYGGSRATARRDEETADWYHMVGETNARGLAVGGKFTLERHPRQEQNGDYVVTRAEYELDFADYEGLDDTGQHTRYTCRFGALPILSGYSPARSTPRPTVQGPQTAIVVGPAGDEIHTDEYGRVKVHFMWDRLSKHNQDSSCYVRVSHPWAGNQWGMIALPRIGQEVVVDFLEGNPDQPIITGRVYNAANMPPYDLPANKTQTGIKTRSTPDGTPDNFNEIRFEDAKGKEQVYIHAERNMDTKVEADSSLSVDANRTVTVGKDRTTTIKGDLDKLDIHKRHEVTVGEGEVYTVTTGGQQIQVNEGGQYLGSLSGTQEFYTDTGQQVTVKGSEGQKVYVEGGQKMLVKEGDATLFVEDFDRKVAAKNVTHVATDGDVTSVASGTFFAQGDTVQIKSLGDIQMDCEKNFSIRHGGNYSVTHTGTTEATTIGASSNMTLSASNDVKLSASNELALALIHSTSLGLKLETAVSATFGLKIGPDFSQSLLTLQKSGLSSEMMAIKLFNGGSAGGGGGGAAAPAASYDALAAVAIGGAAISAGLTGINMIQFGYMTADLATRALKHAADCLVRGAYGDAQVAAQVAVGKAAVSDTLGGAYDALSEGYDNISQDLFPEPIEQPRPPAQDPTEMSRAMSDAVSDAQPPANDTGAAPGEQQ